jgi:hypothetical protein
MGEAKNERMFFPGNQSTGVVRIFLNCQKNNFIKNFETSNRTSDKKSLFCPSVSYKELLKYVTEHQSTSQLGYKEDLDQNKRLFH